MDKLKTCRIHMRRTCHLCTFRCTRTTHSYYKTVYQFSPCFLDLLKVRGCGESSAELARAARRSDKIFSFEIWSTICPRRYLGFRMMNPIAVFTQRIAVGTESRQFHDTHKGNHDQPRQNKKGEDTRVRTL